MTLPTSDTTVLYPGGALRSSSAVLHVETLADGRLGVLLDETPVHAVDTAWPDQPADRGSLSVDGSADAVPLLDAIVGATDGHALFVGTDVPVKKGTEGWAFAVVHVLPGDSAIAEGDTVHVEVDAEYRRALSAGHTACHLASLALDRALAGAWRKDVVLDAAGSPNFDALAIESSSIVPDGSVDVYRIGKSLRRKGFDPSSLDDLEAVAASANATLAEWVGASASASVEPPKSPLTGRREWSCSLPDGRVSIPCGGTHIGSLDAFAAVSIALSAETVDGATILAMRTAATRD